MVGEIRFVGVAVRLTDTDAAPASLAYFVGGDVALTAVIGLAAKMAGCVVPWVHCSR